MEGTRYHAGWCKGSVGGYCYPVLLVPTQGWKLSCWCKAIIFFLSLLYIFFANMNYHSVPGFLPKNMHSFFKFEKLFRKTGFFMAFGNISQGGVNWLSIWRLSGQMSNESLLMIRGIFPWRRLTDLYRPWGRLELGADWPIQFTSSSKSFKISETLSKTLQINNIRTRD